MINRLKKAKKVGLLKRNVYSSVFHYSHMLYIIYPLFEGKNKNDSHQSESQAEESNEQEESFIQVCITTNEI